MKIKELKNQLEQLNPETEIYVDNYGEIYEPILKVIWDKEIKSNYFILPIR